MFTQENKLKVLSLGVVIAILSATVGAYSMNLFSKPTQTASTKSTTATPAISASSTQNQDVVPMTKPSVQMPSEFVPGQTYQVVPTTQDQKYQLMPVSTQQIQVQKVEPATRSSKNLHKVSYNNTASTKVSNPQQRSYYTYEEATKKPSLWNRHRDLLTVGIGTGLGAAIGGIAGGGKGAGIGALAGGAGSALYTYGIRKH